MILTSVKS